MNDVLLATILTGCLAAAGGIFAARLLGISTIVGFVVAGILIGPQGFELLPPAPAPGSLVEFGLVFVLFDLGTRMSFRSARWRRAGAVQVAALQIAGCTLAAAAVALACGRPIDTAILAGSGIAMSSTPIVLQLLKARREAGVPLGRRIAGVLVLQDLFAVLLLALAACIPANSTAAPIEALARAAGTMTITLTAALVVGRFCLRPLLGHAARQPASEWFSITALVVIVVAGGVALRSGVPVVVVAFAIGLAFAESRYATLLHSDLAPLRSVLIGLLFVGVGAELAIDLLFDRPLASVAAATALFGGKAVVGTAAGLAAKLGRGGSIRFGTLLAPGGELALVCFAVAVEVDSIPRGDAALLGVAIALSFVLAPIVVRLGARLAVRYESVPPARVDGDPNAPPKLVVVGFDGFAQRLCRVLAAAGAPYIAMSNDPRRVANGRSLGYAVELGGPDRSRLLSMASVREALVVIVVPKSIAIARATVEKLREIDPELPIFAATGDPAFFQESQRRGLCQTVIKSEETLVALAAAVLRAAGHHDIEIARAIEVAREDEIDRLVPVLD